MSAKTPSRHLPLLELILELLLECLAALRGVHLIFGRKRAEFEVLLDHEAGGKHVVIVHVLDERLHVGLPLDFLGGHSLGHLSGASLKSADESVGELHVLVLTSTKYTR